MTRRGFFGVVAGLFAGASISKKAQSTAYFGGRVEFHHVKWTPSSTRQAEDRLRQNRVVQKMHLNSIYGKFGASRA